MRIIQLVQPDEIYNLTAQSHVAVSFPVSIKPAPASFMVESAISNKEEVKCKVGDVIVKIDPRYFRPTEVETLLGDPSKAHAKLGWKPVTSLQELVKEMVQSDYSAAKRDALGRWPGSRLTITTRN
jgi:GDP-D-mannose dehydratase